MKILVINGSPRGPPSNTLRLTRAFTRGLCSAAPGSEVEELDLKCMNLHECSGCFTCWEMVTTIVLSILSLETTPVLVFLIALSLI